MVGSVVGFPRDEGAHRGAKTEWWYLNGHLKDDQGNRFGMVQTLFDVPDIIEARYNRHLPEMPGVTQLDLGFTDETRGQHYVSRTTHFHPPHATSHPGVEAVHLAEQFPSHQGTWHVERQADDSVHLTGPTAHGHMDLTLQAEKPPLLMGGKGQIPMGPYGESKYYTLPLLHATGTLEIDGQPHHVSGDMWMDHQWGDMQMYHGYDGWNWFGIQLDDKTELNVFHFRGPHHSTVEDTIGISRPDGTQTTSSSLQLTPTAWWRSPHTGAKYPIAWHLVVPDRQISLDLTPTLPDQELPGTPPYCHPKLAPIPTYWEGSMHVQGTIAGRPVSGQAYGEQVGYGDRHQLTDLDAETIKLAREKAMAAQRSPEGVAE
ncbi:MAG: lipocalin family protein [Candidatus Xenobia bacterium]